MSKEMLEEICKFAEQNSERKGSITLHDIDIFNLGLDDCWKIEHGRVDTGVYYSTAKKCFGKFEIVLFN